MNGKTKQIVTAALFAALACVATMVIKIPSPMDGYLNLGDCVVLAAGWLLAPGYGFLAAGLGSGLADLFSGYAAYAPATFAIKGLMALIAFYGFKALSAFEQADAGTFDLILMDIMMPNMNGYEATRAIRSLSREDARTIPIVAMSANAFTEDKVRCREAGMDGHLTKPIDSDKLIDALAKIMAAKEG